MGDAARSAGRRTPRRAVLVVASLLTVAGALLAVPAQGYLEQRTEVASRSAQLDELERRNDDLRARLERLDDPVEIERLARRDHGLVAPGEESYSILPPATAGVVLPRGWPFDRLAAPLASATTGGG
jgi:cell division protein FtsB